jgi:uncharacterized protein
MGLIFEWDVDKANLNLSKHKISFEDASSIFADGNSITIDDPFHSIVEKREITIGLSTLNHLLVVVHTGRNGKIRIISARMASRKEREQYISSNSSLKIP